MKKKIIIFTLLGVLFLIPGYSIIIPVWDAISEQLERNEKLEPSLTAMVSMRDGIRLATDVFLPEGDGPWPVILIRTRYNKSNCNPETYKNGFFAELINTGYAYVVQDTRGQYSSEGIDLIYKTDGWGPLQDGYDTCAWLVDQDWCNGKIGTIGNSALGITQCLMTFTQPPGLVCQVIGSTPGDFYNDWAFPGDVPYGIWAHWLELQEGLWLYGEGFNHFPRDQWWDMFNFINQAPHVSIPALHITGWYDIWTEGTIRRFKAWQTNGGIGAQGNQKLLIGPWGHSPRNMVIDCDRFPLDKLPKLEDSIQRFFNFWLKGERNGLDQDPSITYWEMMPPDKCTEGRYLLADQFPQTEITHLYLLQNQKLSLEIPPKKGGLEFVYDPRSPWRTQGGSNIHLSAGPKDISTELEKDHHLFFMSDPLANEMHITGEVQCLLYLENDVPSSDISAILVDVLPEGGKIILADGIKRVRWSEDAFIELPITQPGNSIKVSIGWTSYTFLPGHRIGLVITGGNWPRFARNPQNGKIHFNADDSQTAHNTIYYGGNKSSRLILPFVPRN